MATLGKGLWDNEKTAGVVASTVRKPVKEPPMAALASSAIRLWFGEIDGRAFLKAGDRMTLAFRTVPKPIYESYAAVVSNPRQLDRSSRSEAHREVIGAACAGPRLDWLLETPEAKPVLQALFERCASGLDRQLSGTKVTLNELQGSRAAWLGVLLELTDVGLYPEPAQVKAWAAGLEAMRERTTEDLEQWDEVMPRWRKAFTQLTRK